ncbi:MAG: phosphopantetheine-binding protein, partial [Cyanobacteria bacterium J06642_2]
MNRKTEYRQRIRALSREQQQQLAQRVDQTHQSERRKEKLTSNRNGLTYSPSTQHLIAYVVPEKNAKTLDSNALRSYLKARLSDAMLPAAFVQLPTLPRNANGKIDRKALPQVNKQFFNTNTVSAPPRNETESVLATIWSEALGLDSISIYDDFFELGGNSILNIQILSRIRDAGFDLHPSQFSAYSNIAELATLLNPTSVSEESTRTDVNINIYPYADRERELETHFPNPEIYRELQAIVAGRQGHRPKPSSLM